jgi:ABC-type phosphate/phosphonate transport system substrate-binding protein
MLPQKQCYTCGLVLLGLSALACLPVLADDAADGKIDILRIGTSGSLTNGIETPKEKASRETLQEFIKEETGLKNEIIAEKEWHELTDKLAKGDIHLGVYQGYEFAWAQAKKPELKPLALSVNVTRYPMVIILAKKDSQAEDMAGLKGQSISIPAINQRYLRMFVEKEAGQPLDKYFSKVEHPDNIDDALDDVVDGIADATAVDKAALDGYERNKPGRFAKLKEIAKSPPYPPVLVAYYDKKLDDQTRNRFKDGLVGASKKEKGQQMLTLFRLTGFEGPPADFDKVLERARKDFPEPKGK